MPESCEVCFLNLVGTNSIPHGSYEVKVGSWNATTTWGDVHPEGTWAWVSNALSKTARDQVIGPPERIAYELYECPKCHGPILVRFVVFDRPPPDGSSARACGHAIYPPPRDARDIALPSAVSGALAEARTIVEAGAFTATVLMCRRAIEAICDNQGVKTGPLLDRLKRLQEEGLIDINLYQWADALRTMGNEAAHGFDRALSKEDAQDALQLTEAIAEYLYATKHRFAAFMERRAAKN